MYNWCSNLCVMILVMSSSPSTLPEFSYTKRDSLPLSYAPYF